MHKIYVFLGMLFLLAVSALGAEQTSQKAAVDSVMEAARVGDKDRVRELLNIGGVELIVEADDLLELLLTKDFGDLAELWWAHVERVAQNPSEKGLPDSLLAGEAQFGHVRGVKFLIGKGTAVDGNLYGQGTPLMHAVRAQHADVAKLLVDAGASVESSDVTGNTILTAAVFEGDLAVLEEVLRAHPKLNRVADGRGTALGTAAQFGSPEVMARLLREPGIEVNATDKEGFTPLLRAAGTGRDYNVIALLKAGARRDLKTPDGKTADVIARESGQLGIVRILSGDSELAEQLANPKDEQPTQDEMHRITALLERWIVDRDWKAVERMLDPRFESSQLHLAVTKYPMSLRKLPAARRAFEVPLAQGADCAVQCHALSECVGSEQKTFEAYVKVIDSDDAHMPGLEQFIGKHMLWVETEFRACGIGVILVMTREGSNSRVVMLEYARVD